MLPPTHSVRIWVILRQSGMRQRVNCLCRTNLDGSFQPRSASHRNQGGHPLCWETKDKLEKRVYRLYPTKPTNGTITGTPVTSVVGAQLVTGLNLFLVDGREVLQDVGWARWVGCLEKEGPKRGDPKVTFSEFQRLCTMLRISHVLSFVTFSFIYMCVYDCVSGMCVYTYIYICMYYMYTHTHMFPWVCSIIKARHFPL